MAWPAFSTLATSNMHSYCCSLWAAAAHVTHVLWQSSSSVLVEMNDGVWCGREECVVGRCVCCGQGQVLRLG